MLIVDDNMYKLAKMQESVLKIGGEDSKKHLENYVKTIMQVDIKAYEELVNLMKNADKYNHTLEDELSYLEKIKTAYNQMVELQMKFISVCEQHGETELKLSDLSQLNIEYVDDRINAINGYLINVKNIEQNKKRLEALNEQLASEEKKREFLEKKILILESKLKDSFIHISLKQVVFGKLENFDIKNEYEKLGYDLIDLIDNKDVLNNKINSINVQLNEIKEKYEIAKVCHNNLFNVDTKNVMNEIEKEFYTIKYKCVMLDMLKLLVQESNNYELAMNKRNEFISLVKDRSECLEKLGMRNPLNILLLVDIQGQLDEIKVLDETVKAIYDIRKEISDTTLKTEEMINQNNDYLISLSETKEMIKSKVSLNDFDITTFDDIVTEEVIGEKLILNNQVTRVRKISSNFKLNIAKQKARGVIERICKLNAVNSGVSKVKEVYTPELVIGPKEEIADYNIEEKVETPGNEKSLFISDNIEILDLVDISEPLKVAEKPQEIINDKLNLEEDIKIEEPLIMINESNEEKTLESPVVLDNDIFEVTTPFVEPVLFSYKSDNEVEELAIQPEVNLIAEEPAFVSQSEVDLPMIDTLVAETIDNENVMPDAFWVTEEMTPKQNEDEKEELSFEEQINALLSENNNEVVGKRR